MASKFDFEVFRGGYDEFAVSKSCTKEEALKIYLHEMDIKNECVIGICDAFVRYGFGVDDGGERQNCWWLCYEPSKRSHKVWAFHVLSKGMKRRKEYEYIDISKDGEQIE